jgi:hypothetical protein
VRINVEITDGNTSVDNQEIWIPSELFARYAEADLDRWRMLIGYRVQHNDSRWGTGIVEAVSWGSPCDHVDAYVQVKIRYGAGWTASVHSASWDQHHQRVAVPAHIESVIRQCLDPSLSDDEQAECLARHARELREQSDRASLDRAKKKGQQVSGDQEFGFGAAR